MVQKRIFGSHYFSYLVKDIKAQQVLASRGAELIHEIQAKEVMEQEQAERDVMEKIKMKMDRIRANQQKLGSHANPDRKSHRQGKSASQAEKCAAFLSSFLPLYMYHSSI